jgi:hypothetical protein
MRTFAIISFLLLGFSDIAKAEKIFCSDREEIVEELISEYDEQLAAVKEIKGEGLLEIHVSARTGSWTALLTKAGRLSCILADGKDAPVPEFLQEHSV